jgi:hypothetical protein
VVCVEAGVQNAGRGEEERRGRGGGRRSNQFEADEELCRECKKVSGFFEAPRERCRRTSRQFLVRKQASSKRSRFGGLHCNERWSTRAQSLHVLPVLALRVLLSFLAVLRAGCSPER